MKCVVCNKNLKKDPKAIKYEKLFLCQSCFKSLLDKTDNKLNFLWIVLCSNMPIAVGAFFKALITPILISDEEVILEISSERIILLFNQKKPYLINALNLIFANSNNERKIIIKHNPHRKKYNVVTTSITQESEESMHLDIEKSFSDILDINIFSDICGIKNKTANKRNNTINFLDGYYNALKILIISAQNDTLNNNKRTYKANLPKEILINPIILLCHILVKSALKLYVLKLLNYKDFDFVTKNLFNKLETLWNNKTLNLDESYWLKEGFLQGVSIKNRFKTIKNLILAFYELDFKKLSSRYSQPIQSKKETNINLDIIEDDIDIIYNFFKDLNIALLKL